jgi:hypothetical protein
VGTDQGAEPSVCRDSLRAWSRLELRFLRNDDTRATQVYRSSDDLTAAANAKREELLAAGWVDAPPHWQMWRE